MSSPELGSYRFDDVAQYEGLFEMIRSDFSDKDQIHCYAMRSAWDVNQHALTINHRGIEGSVYRKFGIIAFAQNEKFLSINSGDLGWRQLALLERMDHKRVMCGALFNLGNVARKTFLSVVSPIALIGYSGEERRTRRVLVDDCDYQRFAVRLAEARSCVQVV